MHIQEELSDLQTISISSIPKTAAEVKLMFTPEEKAIVDLITEAIIRKTFKNKTRLQAIDINT